MISILSSETFSKNMRRILLYYTGYCLLLILIQVSLVSLVAFFHFLLDHDMGVVENWLNRNAWEILTLSKTLGFMLMIKGMRLNMYNLPSYKKLLLSKQWLPNLETIVFILFINIMGVALVDVHGGGFKFFPNRDMSYVMSSYVGNSIFYLLDFLFVFYLFENINIVKKRNKLILTIIIGLMFLSVTNILHPYGKPNQFLILLYFTTIILSYLRDREHFGNPVCITLFLVSIFTILYGHDLVWKGQYALVNFQQPIPLVGLLATWGVGMLYFLRRRSQVD
jgi:hypothetical protein